MDVRHFPRNLRPDGLGIGLALCRSLMQAQHGQVLLESPTRQADGSLRGSKVSLIFPFVGEEIEDLT